MTQKDRIVAKNGEREKEELDNPLVDVFFYYEIELELFEGPPH